MTLKRETRESWGAVPPRARRYDVGWEGVVIHYPGADARFRDMSHARHQRFMRDWQRMHMNQGSNDYEYGSVVCPCGIWMEARTEWDKPGVRAGSNGTSQANYRYTSVQLMVGTREGITEQEKQWLGEAVAWLRSKGWGRKVLGHRDTFPTACPGDAVYNAIPGIKRYADGGVAPEPEPPEPELPEGAEMAFISYVAGANMLTLESGYSVAVSEGFGLNAAKQGVPRFGALKADHDRLKALNTALKVTDVSIVEADTEG